jgi:hypothetical protein
MVLKQRGRGYILKKIQDFVEMTTEQRELWNQSAPDTKQEKLPYGADSKRQIPVKRELRKARNWKPGF